MKGRAMLAIWDGSTWQDGVAIAVIVLVAYLLVMWVAALVWVYRDVAARSHDPFTQTIGIGLVLIFNLPGLLLYLILRPKDTIADRYDRQLEAEALLHELQDQPTCSACRRRIESDFITCPYCRAALRTPCPSCAKALAFGWVACPYCGLERSNPEPARRAIAVVAPAALPEAPPEVVQPERPRRRPSTATFTPPAKPSGQPLPPVEPSPDAEAIG